MKHLVAKLLTFHTEVETDKTILKLLEQIDKTGQTKIAIGVNIENDYFVGFCNNLKEDKFVFEDSVYTLSPWGKVSIACLTSKISKDGVTYGYSLFEASTGLMVIRWLDLEEHSIFPSNFFTLQKGSGKDNDLTTILKLTQGLTGFAFGDLNTQINSFLEKLGKVCFDDELFTFQTVISPTVFTALETSGVQTNSTLYRFHSYKEENKPVAVKQGGQFNNQRAVIKYQGIIFSDNDFSLKGFVSYEKNSTVSEIKIGTFDEEVSKEFNKLYSKHETV